MLHLIKKDFLLVRRVGIILLLLAFATPLFLRFAAGNMPLPSGLSIASVSIILSLTLFNGVFQEEEKFPKASALLTTVGYSRGQQVAGRFVLSLLFFAYCVLAYSLLSIAIAGFAPITGMDLAAALSAYAALTSLHLLLTYLFGVRASQYLTMAVIMLVSLGPTILARLDIRVDLSFLQSVPSQMTAALLLMVGIAAYLCSYLLSVRSFQRKEL